MPPMTMATNAHRPTAMIGKVQPRCRRLNTSNTTADSEMAISR